MTFKTQAEIFQALLAGKTVVSGCMKYKLIDGRLKYEDDNGNWLDSTDTFSLERHWSIKKEPMVIWVNMHDKDSAWIIYQDKSFAEMFIQPEMRTVKFVEVEDTE